VLIKRRHKQEMKKLNFVVTFETFPVFYTNMNLTRYLKAGRIIDYLVASPLLNEFFQVPTCL
jgi:hypothetical protein